MQKISFKIHLSSPSNPLILLEKTVHFILGFIGLQLTHQKNYLVSKKRKDEILQTDISKEENFIIEPIDKDTPENLFHASQLRNIIIESLNGLGEDTKTALTLREFDGLSYEQIAEVVNCPVGTVRSRIFRGREVIDEAIKEYRKGNQSSLAEIKL